MTDPKLLLRFAILLFLCRAAIAEQIIPPWQGPDEPAHYVLAEMVATGDPADPVARAVFERQVVRSMANHEWWRGYRMATPNPVPASFAGVRDALGIGTVAQPVYYVIAAGVLHLVTSTDIENRYLVLRAVSIAFGLATIVMGWLGTRILFDPFTASIAALAVALHPQFVIMSLAVHPDPFVNMLGAFIWWQGARCVHSGSAVAAVLTLLASFTAAAAKRSAVPMIVAATVVVLLGLVRHVLGRISIRRVAVIAASVAACMVLAASITSTQAFARLQIYWSYMLVARRPVDTWPGHVIPYLTALIDDSWLNAGWQRFPAPHWWMIIVRVLTVAGLAGALLAAVRHRALRLPIAVAVLVAGVQFDAVVINALLTGIAAYGRFLYVVITPIAVLVWVGFRQWWSHDWAPLAAPAFMALLIALDLAGWVTTLMPAYA